MSFEAWRPSFQQRSPQLDGLRGIAILLVFANHVIEGVAPHDRPLIPGLWNPVPGGGFMGVQLFFVLSGFLITTILLSERQRTAAVSMKHFYLRRVRRLVPALVVACTAYAIFALVVFHGAELRAAFGAIVRALTYTENLTPIIGKRWPDSGWLQHTWSLAVEEQFYLTWPLVLVLVAPFGRRALLGVAVAGALAMLVLRFGIHSHNIRYQVLRFDALLVGCGLAIWSPRIPRLVVWLAVGVFATWTVMRWHDYDWWEYSVAAVAGGIVLMGSLEARWLGNRVLVFFGQISYGLYIWHVLLMRLDAPTWLTAGGSIGVAVLSYRWIELRFLRRSPPAKPAA